VWHRGDYLPRAYYGSSYIVYDYAPYRSMPRRMATTGCASATTVILTAIATASVLDVLYNIWY
jgi:hypothetical protein